MRFLTAAAAATLSLLLAACEPEAQDDAEEAPRHRKDETMMPVDESTAWGPGVPDDAIAIGDEMYMLPLGRNRDGCAQFRAFSPTRAVLEVIYFQDIAGGFTTDPAKAECE